MKLFILFICLLACFTLTSAHERHISVNEDALHIMDCLIESSQKNINDPQVIRSQIQNYQTFRTSCMQDNENKELACDLITTAQELLERINRAHLEAYFNEDFLQELQFFSKIAHNKTRLVAP